jgi:hypothetical protein
MNFVLFEKCSSEMSLVHVLFHVVSWHIYSLQVLNRWNLFSIVYFLIKLEQFGNNFFELTLVGLQSLGFKYRNFFCFFNFSLISFIRVFSVLFALISKYSV